MTQESQGELESLLGPAASPLARRHAVLLTLLGLGLGLVVEVLFYGHLPGISFFLWAGLCLAAAIVAGRRLGVSISGSSWLLVPGILVFAGVVFLRQEPLTVFLSVALTFFLLALFVRVFRFGRLGRFGWIDMIVAFFWVPIESWIRPWPLVGEAWKRSVNERGSRHVVFSVLRGLLLALPILVVFIALLSAADLIFGDYVRQALAWVDLARLMDWTGRVILILISGLFLLGALAVALRDPGERKLIGEDPPLVRPFLGFTETTLVLGLVGLLFLLFVIVQFAYLFGGEANIHAAGYTYAEYARRGFGELVAVAVLSLGMIYVLAFVSRLESRGRRRAFFGLCAGIVLLVGVMLASAYQRLVLYENAYGFSRLRTYTHAAIAWLAVSFVVFLVFLGLRRLRALAPAALAIAVGFTATLAMLDVDGFIVRQNGVRYERSGDLDVSYLATLSNDAIPGLVALATRADSAARGELLPMLSCRQELLVRQQAASSWPSASLSRARALASLRAMEPVLAAYPVSLDLSGGESGGPPSYVVNTPDGEQPCPRPGD
jgi:hypothetical protein